MSTMANTAPIVTTVTKTSTKEKTPKEMDTAPRVNILHFCEEHYEDILPVIMDKIRRDKRKEVHTMLDFGDNTKRSRRIREGSQNLSAGTLSARYRNPSERPKERDRLKDNDGNVEISKDHSHSRGRPHRRDSSLSKDRPRSRDRSRGIKESYGNTCSSYRTRAGSGHHSRDKGRSSIMKRGRERTARVWFDELPPESIDVYKDLKAAFLAYFMQQKKYIKDPVEIHNIKEKDGETIEDFMERFKVETGRMKGAPECM
ncbi:reverse transcriptase domain-containing protein [Tanacetum coccineum]